MLDFYLSLCPNRGDVETLIKECKFADTPKVREYLENLKFLDEFVI